MNDRAGDTLKMLGVIVGAGVIIGGLVCLGGFLSRCQKCDKWFSQRTSNKVKVRQQAGAKDLDRHDKHFDKEGKYAGETTRKERIYGKWITYDVTINCGSCGNQFHEMKREWRDD